ncbi:MAG TPA: YggS family pyridoxal phosphate-dependent enzyme [Gammaproteobacteria bacterium]
MTQITYHLADIRKRVSVALRDAGRGAEHVMIVAVSKQHPPECIAAAYRAGQSHFGESYVQEALPKIERLRDLPIEWHYIGPIQANKTRAIAERFQWAHSVDRAKIAQRLSAQRPVHAPPLNVLIQANLAGEPQKAGAAPGAVLDLAKLIARLPGLRLRGLMGVPPTHSTRAESASYFRELHGLQHELAAAGVLTDTLSMGMSDDFETAIANGSTCVRIGTAIFGPRRK